MSFLLRCCHNGFWRQELSLAQGFLTRLDWLDYLLHPWVYKSMLTHFVFLWGMNSSPLAWPTSLLAELSAPASHFEAQAVNDGEVCDCVSGSLAARGICVGVFLIWSFLSVDCLAAPVSRKLPCPTGVVLSAHFLLSLLPSSVPKTARAE